MSENADPLHKALDNARISFYQGNHSKTRYWARIAAKLDPNIEEPWLWLAAVSSPRASVAYLQKALYINPNSKRAKEGMHWAIKRIRAESPPPISRPVQRQPPVTITPRKTATKTKISPIGCLFLLYCLLLLPVHWFHPHLVFISIHIYFIQSR